MAARDVPRPRPTIRTWPRQVAAAAALVIVGWWGHDYLSTPTPPGIPSYVSDAVGAHSVFGEDSIFPVEFDAAAASEAASWFSQKSGSPFEVPGLQSLGLDMIGARLLGSGNGPLAQFLYEDQDGGRISLTVAKHPSDAPLQAIEVVDYPDRTVGYWRNSDFDYALVSQSSTADVREIAMLIE